VLDDCMMGISMKEHVGTEKAASTFVYSVLRQEREGRPLTPDEEYWYVPTQTVRHVELKRNHDNLETAGASQAGGAYLDIAAGIEGRRDCPLSYGRRCLHLQGTSHTAPST
jgi:hypothetical protein